mgnify:CR=1 FL=1|tara:strand:- start:74 stop:232 length:159 start_codon:yes stop_codon:yes gene_type:complete
MLSFEKRLINAIPWFIWGLFVGLLISLCLNETKEKYDIEEEEVVAIRTSMYG